MTNTMPKKCPACSQEMHVCLLRCPVCHTEVQGDFRLNRFSQLSDEQFLFLETFIQCRGSLKDVGAALSISYPTARNRLDQLIRSLGFEDKDSETARRMEVLEQLKNGEISTQEALALLQGGMNHE